MKRIEYLKNINVKNLKLTYLSKNCYLLTNKEFILKASTFEDWKKYIFNFKEVKLILNIIKEVYNVNKNFMIDFYKINNNIISISLINNKIVYEVVKININKNVYENTLIFYGHLKELCKKNNLKEEKFI